MSFSSCVAAVTAALWARCESLQSCAASSLVSAVFPAAFVHLSSSAASCRSCRCEALGLKCALHIALACIRCTCHNDKVHLNILAAQVEASFSHSPSRGIEKHIWDREHAGYSHFSLTFFLLIFWIPSNTLKKICFLRISWFTKLFNPHGEISEYESSLMLSCTVHNIAA